jgi:nucleotide-binding universal stress UspA family protein
MRILLAADGSTFTKKALAFLVNHEALAADGGEVVVFHVQVPMPPHVQTMVGAKIVADYQADEAEKVLAPIRDFLQRHAIPFRTSWTVGHAAQEIVIAAQREACHMIVMGTHGHGLLSRAFMGSVAQNVVAHSEIPVLLVM